MYGDPSVSPNPCLKPLDEAPFYAMPIYPGDIGTNGGLRTDHRARVLRPDGSAIMGYMRSATRPHRSWARAIRARASPLDRAYLRLLAARDALGGQRLSGFYCLGVGTARAPSQPPDR